MDEDIKSIEPFVYEMANHPETNEVGSYMNVVVYQAKDIPLTHKAKTCSCSLENKAVVVNEGALETKIVLFATKVYFKGLAV